MFEGELVGTYLASPDGTILDCDTDFLAIFGFRTRREARTTNLKTLWADAAGYETFMEELRKKRNLAQYAGLRRRRDGEVIQASETAVGDFNQLGDMQRIRGNVMGATTGRLAVQARREAEQAYCELLMSLPEAIFVSDAQERIVVVNPAAVELVGAERAEALRGQSLRQFLVPPERPMQGEPVEGPERRKVMRLDGSTVDVETLPAAIQLEGNICTLRLCRVITPTIRTEEALLEKDREIALHLTKIERLKDALSTLLEHRDQETQRQLAGVRLTLDQLVLAYLGHLNATPLTPDQRMLIEVIEANLRDITSSFTHALASWEAKLTPTELQIVDLLRQGKRTKEVAALLRVSRSAVTFHRNNIRAKLGLTRQPINLVSYLRTVAETAREASGSVSRRIRQRVAAGRT